MTTDIRAVLERLITASEECTGWDCDERDDAIAAARAVLAQTGEEGPSERIASIAKAVQNCAFNWEPTAQLIGNVCAEDVADLCAAVLEEGRPAAAPEPVAVSERLPGEGDCCGNPRNGDGQWCWGRQWSPTSAGTPVVWRLMRIDCLIEEAVEWMPWWALPLPTNLGGEVEG